VPRSRCAGAGPPRLAQPRAILFHGELLTNIQIRPPSRCHGGGGGVIHNSQLRHSTTRRASKSRAARIIPTNHHELEEQQTPAPGDRRLLVDSSVARHAIYVSAQPSSTYCALVTEPETFLYMFVRHASIDQCLCASLIKRCLTPLLARLLPVRASTQYFPPRHSHSSTRRSRPVLDVRLARCCGSNKVGRIDRRAARWRSYRPRSHVHHVGHAVIRSI